MNINIIELPKRKNPLKDYDYDNDREEELDTDEENEVWNY